MTNTMHRTLQDILWLLPAALQFLVVLSLVRCRRFREYPAFTSYLVLEVIRTTVLFTIGYDPAHYSAYFYSYWISEMPACLLAFLSVAEIFRKAFVAKLGLRRRGTALFRFSVASLFAAAAIVAVLSPGNDSRKLIAAVVVLKRAESIVLFGLCAALFVFVFAMGLPWTNSTIGICAGFALSGAADVTGWAARAYYGRAANQVLIWLNLAAGVCQTFIWAAYLLRARDIVALPDAPGSGVPVDNLPSEIDRLSAQADLVVERRC